MKKFKYKVKIKSGETQKGVVEAGSERQAAQILREKGFLVISLAEKREASLWQEIAMPFAKTSQSDVANFTRQLSTMITAGLPLTDALKLLHDQVTQTTARVVEAILRDVEGGTSLGEALEKHPKVFSKVYVALVRSGEAAGILEKILARLADNLEKEREFSGKVKGAMMYPAIVFLGMLGVTAIMMIFVVPKLLELYRDFGTELPFATKILMFASDIMVKFWWLLLIGLFGAFISLSRFKKTKAGNLIYDKVMFSLPILGNLRKKIVLTEFTRTLGLLAGAGIPIVESLNIVSGVLGNSMYENSVKEAAKKVEKGFSLAVAISRDENFPPIMGQMVSVGEETGKMDEVLLKVSHYFETESEQMVKGLTTAMEPIIMIVLGLGVGFLVFSVITPIYKLTSSF
jgi:type IV pilus assembly protein PilC